MCGATHTNALRCKKGKCVAAFLFGHSQLFQYQEKKLLHIDVEPFKPGPKIKGTLFKIKIGVQDCRAGNGF